jgi:hypothetical protein
MSDLLKKWWRRCSGLKLTIFGDFVCKKSGNRVGNYVTEIMVRCGPCTFGDFKCAYVSLHFFELQHYENRVAKKYADTNNNRLS